eukprot:Gb_35100 [translate_table: standard]
MVRFACAELPRVTSLKNVEPIATFDTYGEDEYFVADSRGYEYLLHKIAEEFLKSEKGSIIDNRLNLNKVVREIQYTNESVKVLIEDGSIYTANYIIVSTSIGVLQTKLIKFKPDLPQWKILSIFKWDMVIYTKIFMKFPFKFWPTGLGTEFFIYAHEKRGYYNFWQHLENEYPGANLLMVTVTDDESRRIEQQDDNETKAEAMAVLRNMFGNHIPDAEEILVPKWGRDRFYCGTYSNWPIGVSTKDFNNLKAPIGPVYFTGEHTSQDYNGFVHGAYLAGIDTANMLLSCINEGDCAHPSHRQNVDKNASYLVDIQREREIGTQAWMEKVQQWKILSIFKWDMVIYTKIFMKFPFKFWPTGLGTEFFIYAHEKRGYYNFWQHLENEYPGANLLMVTVTDDESRRIEQQDDNETKAEAMAVLRNMFGNHIPDAEEILVPKWGRDRFYCGTYSNWPIGVSTKDFNNLKAPVGSVYFTGEHTSQDYNGFVHGAYLAGIDTANMLLSCINEGDCAHPSHRQNVDKNASYLVDIQREREIGTQAWMEKVQVLEDALSTKCNP